MQRPTLVYAHLNTHVDTHVYTRVYARLHTHVYACVYTHLHTRVYTHGVGFTFLSPRPFGMERCRAGDIDTPFEDSLLCESL